MADPTMTLIVYLRKVGVDLEGDFLSQGTQGNFFPSLLEPRRRAEGALLTVIQTAYVQGVSTRKVDELVQALGMTGIDTPALAGGARESKVSRICRELDEFVEAFRERRLEGNYPYVWLDALYLKVRQDHRIVSQALVVAIAVKETGQREILGLSLGQSEEYAFWLDFLRGLVRRGLRGVQLVISDAHEGLKAALQHALSGATWQRCRVHFTPAPHCVRRSAGVRNVLTPFRKGSKSVVAAFRRSCARSSPSPTGLPPPSNYVKWSQPWSLAGPRPPRSWPWPRKTYWPT